MRMMFAFCSLIIFSGCASAPRYSGVEKSQNPSVGTFTVDCHLGTNSKMYQTIALTSDGKAWYMIASLFPDAGCHGAPALKVSTKGDQGKIDWLEDNLFIQYPDSVSFNSIEVLEAGKLGKDEVWKKLISQLASNLSPEEKTEKDHWRAASQETKIIPINPENKDDEKCLSFGFVTEDGILSIESGKNVLCTMNKDELVGFLRRNTEDSIKKDSIKLKKKSNSFSNAIASEVQKTQDRFEAAFRKRIGRK